MTQEGCHTATATNATVTLCSPQSLLLLCLLPFCNICGFLWCYTALPLHFVDSEWPLWQLSLLLTLIYVPRVMITTLTSRVGDWLCVPVSGLAAALNIYLVMRPESITAVWVAVSATCASLNPPAFRSFVHARFFGSGTWNMQRALRIFTLSDTLGYACAPFIGGLLYDNGGVRSCAYFAAATCSMCALLPLTLIECRLSIARAWSERGSSPRKHTTKGASITTNTATATATTAADYSGTLTYYGWPVFVVMLAAFANICVYAVEWCLYALYFRLEYGWSGAWCGFAQMLGDLLGAAVLGISTMGCVVSAAQRCELPRSVGVVMRPPFSVALLICSHGVLMAMLAQPQFLVSLLGQILMGTTYVFVEQGLQVNQPRLAKGSVGC